MLYVPIGLFLLAAWALVILADYLAIAGCAECSHPAQSPIHFSCRGGACVAARSHHVYRFPGWPYGLVALLSLLYVIAGIR